MRKILALLLLMASPVLADHGVTWYDLGGVKYLQVTAPPALAGNYRVIFPTSTIGVSTTMVMGIDTIVGSTITLKFVNVSAGGGVWGSITGTLSNQTDLQAVLSALSVSTSALQTQANAIAVDTGTIAGNVATNTSAIAANTASIVAIGVSTGSLQTQVTAAVAGTSALAVAVAASTNTLQTNINTLTTTVASNATAVAASTNTLQTNITTVQTNLTASNTAVAASTNTLQTNINAVGVATGTISATVTANAAAVATSTNTLQTNINAVGVATGTIITNFESSTNTYTGGNIYNSYTNHVGSSTFTGGVAISSTIVLGNPASTFTSTGTITSSMSVVQVSAPNTGAFITLTLPSASANPGLDITIYKVDATTTEVKIVGAGTDLIEGTGTIRLDAQFQHASLHSLGATGWGSGYGGIQTTPAWLGPALDGTTGVVTTASGTIVTPFSNAVPVTVTGFRYYVTAGSGGKGVFGIYNQFGTLVMSTGPVTIGSFGAATIATTPTNLPPGQYYFAFQPSNAAIAIGGTSANGGNGALFCSLTGGASMGLANPYVFPGTSTVSCYSIYVLVNGGRLTL